MSLNNRNPSPPKIITYKAKLGDSLYFISRIFNVSLTDLITLNPNINPDDVKVGDTLTIPLVTSPVICPTGSTPYSIEPGDTLYALSLRFNIPLNRILAVNPKINNKNLSVGETLCMPNPRSRYENTAYGVTFMYPASWKKTGGVCYQGEDGYFSIAASKGPYAINELCEAQTRHPLKPYGIHPKIKRLTIEDQEACLILPSQDQHEGMVKKAALLIRYPSPIILLDETYPYFILWADQSHIREIGSTLEFLTP